MSYWTEPPGHPVEEHPRKQIGSGNNWCVGGCFSPMQCADFIPAFTELVSLGQHLQCPPEACHPRSLQAHSLYWQYRGEHQYLSPGLEEEVLNTIWCQSNISREKQKTVLEYPIPRGRGLLLIPNSSILWVCVHMHMCMLGRAHMCFMNSGISLDPLSWSQFNLQSTFLPPL